MKECAMCHLPKDDSEFGRKRNGVLQPYCRPCVREYGRKHYHNNKKYYRDKSIRYRNEGRDWLNEYKSTRGCSKCSENHPAALDFHHRDPSQKISEIATMRGKVISIKRLQTEVDKCDILCANCHRKLHWEEKHARVGEQQTRLS